MMKASIPPRCKIFRWGSASVRTPVSSLSPARTNWTYSNIRIELSSFRLILLSTVFPHSSDGRWIRESHRNIAPMGNYRVMVSHPTKGIHHFKHSRGCCLLFLDLSYLYDEHRWPAGDRESIDKWQLSKWFYFEWNQHGRIHSSNWSAMEGRETRRRMLSNGWRNSAFRCDWSLDPPVWNRTHPSEKRREKLTSNPLVCQIWSLSK